jgi:hypothetical protein
MEDPVIRGLGIRGIRGGLQAPGRPVPSRVSDLVQYCQLCGKVAELTLGSDFTQTIVNLSIS